MINSKYTLKWVLIILLLIVILYIYFNKSEYFTTPAEAISNVASMYADTSGSFVFNNIQVKGNINIGNQTFKLDGSGNLIITDISNNIIFQSNADDSITMNLTGSTINGGTMTNTVGINNILKNCLLADSTGRYVLIVTPSPWTMPNNTSPVRGGGIPVDNSSMFHTVNTTGGALTMWDINSDGNGKWVSTTTNIPNGVYGSGTNTYMIVEPWDDKGHLSIYFSGYNATLPPALVGRVFPSQP